VLTLPLMALGPFVALLANGWPGFLHALELLAVLFAGGIVLHRTGWLGGGDIKLAIAIGVLLGYPRSVTFLLCTGVAGGLLALGIALSQRRGALLAGQVRSAVAATMTGSANIPAIATAPVDDRIPYAFAIAAGLILTLLLPIVDPSRFAT
jgi:prepilin peptidase CpaA